MNAVDTSPQNSASSRDESQRVASGRLPIDEPVEDLDHAIQKLKACSSTELRRARQHHRRALESLRQGGYNALSESTREHLVARLRRNLNALNQALETTTSGPEAGPSDTSDDAWSLSSRLRTFFQALW